MSRESASIVPREAAIAASLAGAVVVALAYASGFGLRTPLVAAPVGPVAPVPSSPTTTPSPSAAPVPVLQPVVQPVPVAPPTVAPVPPAPADVPTPRPPHPSAPAPATAVPTAIPSSCAPGDLSAVLAPVGDLLHGLIGVDLLGPGTGLLDCTVGSLLGPPCCDPAATARGATR